MKLQKSLCISEMKCVKFTEESLCISFLRWHSFTKEFVAAICDSSQRCAKEKSLGGVYSVKV